MPIPTVAQVVVGDVGDCGVRTGVEGDAEEWDSGVQEVAES